jgi:hypothetical protein
MISAAQVSNDMERRLLRKRQSFRRGEHAMPSRNRLDPDQVSDPDIALRPKGHDVRSLGPSDSSDSGSDMIGLDGDDDSDRSGTGEDMTAAGRESDIRESGDIAPDRIVGPEEAGLGGGLDQAEEALLGVTDEELAERLRGRRQH